MRRIHIYYVSSLPTPTSRRLFSWKYVFNFPPCTACGIDYITTSVGNEFRTPAVSALLRCPSTPVRSEWNKIIEKYPSASRYVLDFVTRQSVIIKNTLYHDAEFCRARQTIANSSRHTSIISCTRLYLYFTVLLYRSVVRVGRRRICEFVQKKKKKVQCNYIFDLRKELFIICFFPRRS